MISFYSDDAGPVGLLVLITLGLPPEGRGGGSTRFDPAEQVPKMIDHRWRKTEPTAVDYP